MVINISGGSDADAFDAWLKSFNDPNMYRVAHLAYGFGPNAALPVMLWKMNEYGVARNGALGNIGGILPLIYLKASLQPKTIRWYLPELQRMAGWSADTG